MVNHLSCVYDAKDMWRCDHLLSVDSTQREAIRRLNGAHSDAQALRPFVLWTTQQTQGQGRHGRAWLDCGASLAMTFAWPDTLHQGAQQAWPLRVSLMAVETLQPLLPAQAPLPERLGLKWPNDIMAGQGKLGGVLVSRQRFQNDWWLVAGLGINLRWERAAPADREVTDLFRLGVILPDPTALVDRLLVAMTAEVGSVVCRPAAELVSRFAAQDVYANQPVTLHDAGSGRIMHQGIDRGITPTGELQLQENDRIVTATMGELSLRSGAHRDR